MLTRENIHQTLKSHIDTKLASSLKDPLVKQINCINKGDFNKRFDLRVAKDASQLGNWWRHPIYLLAKPSASKNTLTITIQPQRWPADPVAFASENSAHLNAAVENMKNVAGKHLLKVSNPELEVKTDGKFVASITLVAEWDAATALETACSSLINLIADLAHAAVQLSDKLPVVAGENKAENEDIPAEDAAASADVTEEGGDAEDETTQAQTEISVEQMKEVVLGNTLASIIFLYLCAAGVDGQIMGPENELIKSSAAEWTEDGEIMGVFSVATDLWKSLGGEQEKEMATKVAVSLREKFTEGNLKALINDLYKIITADGEEVSEYEKGFFVFICSVLEGKN